MTGFAKISVFLTSFLPVAQSAAAASLQVVWRTPVGTVEDGVFYRFATCPDGNTVVVNSSGRLVVVSGTGVVTFTRDLDSIAGASAAHCSKDGTLFIAAKGWLRPFRWTGTDVVPERSLWIAGLTNQLLVTPTGQIYTLGVAKLGTRHVNLRQFRASDGSLIAAPEVGRALRTTASLFDDLATNGLLLWTAAHRVVLFFPPNPFEVWRFDEKGAVAGAKAPTAFAEFETAPAPASVQPRWNYVDKVIGAAPLPSGDLVVQIAPMPSLNRDRFGWRYGYLQVMDSNFDPKSVVELHERLGMLSGADANGNLYFVNLIVGSQGLISRVHLLNWLVHHSVQFSA